MNFTTLNFKLKKLFISSRRIHRFFLTFLLSFLLSEAQSETGWNSNQQGMDMLAIFTDQGMDNRGRSELMNYYGDDLAIIDNDAYNSLSGYVISDLNGDNFVDGTDLVIVDNNALKFVTIVRP